MDKTIADQLAAIPLLNPPHSDEPDPLDIPGHYATCLTKITFVIEFEPLSEDQSSALTRLGMPLAPKACGARVRASAILEVLSFFSGLTGLQEFKAVLVVGPREVFTGEMVTLLTLLCELAGLGSLPPGVVDDE